MLYQQKHNHGYSHINKLIDEFRVRSYPDKRKNRYGRKSTLIVSQLAVAEGYEYRGESMVSLAIIDRLAGNARRVDLKGDALRDKN